jgi:nucleotide-binding universal stress UspA family protein
MATRPIVVGTDGSDEAMRAVEWAAEAAEWRKAPLRVVSVATVPRPAVWMRALPEPIGSLAHSAAAQALSRALARAAELAPGVLIDGDLLAGSPALNLVASASGAAMVVVGSRGAGGFAALVLGSVSRYVATQAPVPAVVVRQETPASHGKVAVGVRDPDTSGAALAFAFEEASLRKASLLAVHAWFHPGLRRNPEVARLVSSGEMSAKMANELGNVLLWYRERYPEVPVTEESVHAHPGHALADMSARVDLLVIGRRGRGATPGVKAVTHAVLNHLRGPVACVPATPGLAQTRTMPGTPA